MRKLLLFFLIKIHPNNRRDFFFKDYFPVGWILIQLTNWTQKPTYSNLKEDFYLLTFMFDVKIISNYTSIWELSKKIIWKSVIRASLKYPKSFLLTLFLKAQISLIIGCFFKQVQNIRYCLDRCVIILLICTLLSFSSSIDF